MRQSAFCKDPETNCNNTGFVRQICPVTCGVDLSDWGERYDFEKQNNCAGGLDDKACGLAVLGSGFSLLATLMLSLQMYKKRYGMEWN